MYNISSGGSVNDETVKNYRQYSRENDPFEKSASSVNYSKANPCFSHNENKEVKITSVKKASDTTYEDRTWRNNLSSIIKAVETSSSFLPGTTDNLDVKEEIYLCLEEVPSQSFKVKTNKGFSSLVSSFTGGKYGKTESTESKGMSLVDKINIGGAAWSAIKGMFGSEGSSSTFNPWSLYSPTWDESSTETYSFKQTFHFKMGQYRLWNAKEEVVKPLLNLIAPVMNQQVGSFFTKGPFPSCWDLLGKCLTENKDNIVSRNWDEYVDSGSIKKIESTWSNGLENFIPKLLSNAEEVVDILGGVLQAIILAGYKQYLYTVKIGSFMTFNKVFYEDAEVHWSSETDQFGFPIAGSATISFRSILPPAVSTMNKNTLFATFDTTLER